jgi:flagellin
MLGAADADAHRLIIESMGEGSRQFVSVHLLNSASGAVFNVKDSNGNTVETAYGSDMVATINGMRTKADGRELQLESAMLKMRVILDDKVTSGDQLNFTITGGGAVVQMGADVVSNQQIRFGLKSVSTANLGGGSGKLYQLRTGEIGDLTTSDSSRRLADRIVNEAIMSISRTRGLLGTIQRYTLEPQAAALQDGLVALTSAEAQISNADFAEESSRLTRAQILVQAGTRTLSIANQFPQYAASLLGG